MLRVGRHDLVVGPEVEAGEDDVAAVGRRPRQRHALAVDAHEPGEQAAHTLARLQHRIEVLAVLRGRARGRRRAARRRPRPWRARAARRFRRSGTRADRAPDTRRARPPTSLDDDLHGRMVREEPPVRRAAARHPRPRSARERRRGRGRGRCAARAPARRSPIPGRSASSGPSTPAKTLKSPASTATSSGRATASAKTVARRISAAASRPSGGYAVACRFVTRTPLPSRSRMRTACATRRSFAHASRASTGSSSQRACARRNRRAFSTRPPRSSARSHGATRIAFACPVKTERKSPWWRSVIARPTLGRRGQRPDRRPRAYLGEDLHPGPFAQPLERPHRHLLQADDLGLVAGNERAPSARARRPAATGSCCRGRGSSCG